VSDRISLSLGRRDMDRFPTVQRPGRLPVVHVVGRHATALCPRPSVRTNGSGWREIINVGPHPHDRAVDLRAALHVRVEWQPAPEKLPRALRGHRPGRGQRPGPRLVRKSRPPGPLGRRLGTSASRALLRLAVGQRRSEANAVPRRRLRAHLAIGEYSVGGTSSTPPSSAIPPGAWSWTWHRGGAPPPCCLRLPLLPRSTSTAGS
jgi:hypothetical protein